MQRGDCNFRRIFYCVGGQHPLTAVLFKGVCVCMCVCVCVYTHIHTYIHIQGPAQIMPFSYYKIISM